MRDLLLILVIAVAGLALALDPGRLVFDGILLFLLLLAGGLLWPFGRPRS